MTTEPVADELRSLITQTEEQVAYFQELGVTGIALETVLSAETPAQPRSRPARVTRRASAVPTTNEKGPLSAPPSRAVPAEITKSMPVNPPVSSITRAALFGDMEPAAVEISRSGESMEQVGADIGNCTRCPLHEGRKHIVHTEGTQRARLMFVGEAPGADEDLQARPFVGRAGQLLTKIIESIGFKREEVLIGNINRCRPPGNRPPTPDEVAMCKPFLLREIASVRPEVIVVLGNTAMKNLLDVKEGITKLRGIFQNYQGIKIMPTFHPAYLLRDPSKKRETWEDLKKVRDYLDSTAKREI
ncbi:MAG: uracil-DNA glycosylase [Pyrinomonadaceae bacterium]|nr:uracil-DNA glycosylase [Pyrinomonadaceae bacterium]